MVVISDRFAHLPPEIVRIILSYDGTIQPRNGVYMNQIPLTDLRYRMLLTIPRKHFSYTFTQVNLSRIYRMTVVWREESSVTYTFDSCLKKSSERCVFEC